MKISKLNRLLPFLLITIHYLVLTQIQFIAWPEMFSYPYLLSKGYLIYKDIINPYPPLLPFSLQFYYSIFGMSLFSLKFISFFIIIVTDVTLFLVLRKIFNINKALLTLGMFILLQPSLEGNSLWFDLVITPLFILAYYFIYKYIQVQNKNLLLSNALILLLGFILSLAFLIKQTSIFVILSIGLLLIIRGDRRKLVLLIYSLALIFPVLIVSYFMFKQGIFSDYLFWVYQYPFQHLKSAGFLLYPTYKQLTILMIILLPVCYTLFRYRSDKKILTAIFLFIPSLLFSFPRFSYFHLQPALPFICITIPYLFYKLTKKKRLIFGFGYLTLICLIFALFFLKWYKQESRFYDNNTIRIASVLHNKLKDKGEIFFYNVSSEFFVISKLLPSRPWADTFPWYLETRGLQEKIINSLETHSVSYVVFRPFANEAFYTPGTYKPLKINNYIEQNFQLEEKIDKDIWILRKKQG